MILSIIRTVNDLDSTSCRGAKFIVTIFDYVGASSLVCLKFHFVLLFKGAPMFQHRNYVAFLLPQF